MRSKINHAAVAATLLRLRESTACRAALRRGHTVATEHYAYQYLAPLWMAHGDHFRVPLLRVAALAATSPDVADDPSGPATEDDPAEAEVSSGDSVDRHWEQRITLGRFLRRGADASLPPSARHDQDAHHRALERFGTRLMWVQNGDVELLHTAMRTMFPTVDVPHPAVSWRDVVATYLWWDQPDDTHKRRHRRRLLEQFYAAPIGAGDDSTTPTTADAADKETA